MKTNNTLNAHRCPKCGKPVECDISAGKKECWCFAFPPVQVIDGRECLCPECLASLVAADSSSIADKQM